jgi:hypothetical protein
VKRLPLARFAIGLNRLGNQRLNAILYRFALTQAHLPFEVRTYLARRVAEGKTRREAA